MTAATSRAILPEPPDDLKRLSDRLSAVIRERIRDSGPMPFSAYMEAALYEPGLGYYSAGLRKFGAGGDFVTAPELGSLFATCLSRQTVEICAQVDSWVVLEIGAGSGRLASGLLERLAEAAGAGQLRYLILERSAHLRQVQRETIAEHAPDLLGCVEWLDQPPGDAWRGVVLANEVVDALPVERFCKQAGELQQLNVIAGETGFDWMPGPPRAALAEAVEQRLGSAFDALPEGYCSEVNLALPAWLDSVTGKLQQGVALLIDYGYPRHEYYLPQRRTGTLICHYRQRAVDAPFRWPGLQDISAFVDFTALAEAGDHCGLACSGYTTQGMFLLGAGLDEEMADLTERPAAEQLRIGAEARQLTLPGEMGEKFQVMALNRGFDAPLRGFALLDLRHRL